MSDTRIKARIRKLMVLAGDGAASEAEIDNAMRFAARLMDEHHISHDDLADDPSKREVSFTRSDGVSQYSKLTLWESTLARAICALIGSTNHYISNEAHVVRVNGIAQTTSGGSIRRGQVLKFYGPADDAAEAASLFEEWGRLVATMGVARWGGCCRGEGAQYCYGFAQSLHTKAMELNTERQLTAATPPKLLGQEAATTAITLAGRYEIIRKAARNWLASECGVRLSKGRRRSIGLTNPDAYAEGKTDGSRAGFGRASKPKGLLR